MRPGISSYLQIVKPKSAFVIVDVQNDFISGSLAIKNCPAGQDGEEVVPPINTLLDTVPFTMHCYSLVSNESNSSNADLTSPRTGTPRITSPSLTTSS